MTVVGLVILELKEVHEHGFIGLEELYLFAGAARLLQRALTVPVTDGLAMAASGTALEFFNADFVCSRCNTGSSTPVFSGQFLCLFHAGHVGEGPLAKALAIALVTTL